ncbi:MAG TPA: hypothetical protein VGD37_32665 [Kofleriaceae bacterium]|jgi:hypothetical protein
MITFETRLANDHRARGFFRELPVPQAAEAIVAERYWDDDDQAREPVLRHLLARTNVSAIAYPTLGYRDVLQVFLRDEGDDDLVFACALVSGARLRDMLAQSSPIIEGFTLQVLPSEHLSVESIRAALQSWIERCFPRLVLPNLTVERWTGPDGILLELLELLLSRTSANDVVSMEAPAELCPDPGIAQPPYGLAA